MGFFQLIGQSVRSVGKSFQHVGKSLVKGLSDPYKLVKITAHAASGITRPLAKGLGQVQRGVGFALKFPVIGDAIRVGDFAISRTLGVSPIEGLGIAQNALETFNKLEGKLEMADSAEQFLSQNRGDIKKMLAHPALRGKMVELLRQSL